MKNSLKQYLHLPFVITLLLLLGFAAGMDFVKVKYGVTLIKKPLPLKLPFDKLDESLLKPYRVVEKAKIDNRDIVESLGTEEYLQWILEDANANQSSPVKNCSVFITYYTGNPDQVPHVPEACYVGGGHQVDEKFQVLLDVSDINTPHIAKSGKLEATGLVFSRKSAEIWQSGSSFPVIYFFNVNGRYAGGRTGVRLALGDLKSRYSYFSKVEIKFFNPAGLQPDKKQAIEATERLLKVLLPALEKNHWPDWEE